MRAQGSGLAPGERDATVEPEKAVPLSSTWFRPVSRIRLTAPRSHRRVAEVTASPRTVRLPTSDGGVEPYELGPPAQWEPLAAPSTSRTVYAAAHVVADPDGAHGPHEPSRIDWDATIAYRHHLWDLGLGVADAMDTAQRNGGLDWPATRELIRRSGAEARGRGAAIVCGVGTDHLPADVAGLDAIVRGYEEQLAVVSDAGATPVIMASRQLARLATSAAQYEEVYGRVIAAADRPVILHWLGEAFDQHLRGYWGDLDLDLAMETVLGILASAGPQVDGIKVSVLQLEREVTMRRRLTGEQRMYCGDDFHYPELIAGDDRGHSHALLGILDAIAPLASTALAALDRDDHRRFRSLLDASVGLSRHLFEAPTQYYKTGITFLAWLAGYQEAFMMVGGVANARSLLHLAEALRLADDLGLFPDPELAAARAGAFFMVGGVR